MKKRIFAIVLCFAMMFTAMAYMGVDFGVVGSASAAENNVHNVTQNKWYATLSGATAAAENGDTIEVHNSFTETTTVKIQKNGLKIRAAEGKSPVISWTNTEAVPVSGATSYNCIVVYTSVTGATAFGGGTGTLTLDASKASDADNKGKRARVLMHCGSGNLNLVNGIVITGGNPGGGSYSDKRVDTPFPEWSGEIVGEVGFGAGVYMYNGTLNMSGGTIKDNYSLWGATAADKKTSHNYVGGGGGVYIHSGTMNMSGGTITHNAAGSGGGAGILVGHGAKLTVSGGTISENVVNFASGGGIGVRTTSEVTITGGNIINNHVTGHGGGLFARGDSIPLNITGGKFEGNTAGGYGGGILFWTVGDDVSKNTVVIGGDTQIKNNSASRGGGVSVGREVKDGKPIGNKAKLIIQDSPIISGNTATTYGGGIEMQSDEFSTAVNTVNISGGTISGNTAKDGGGIYVPGGTVTMAGGSFINNKASNRGAGIFTGGGEMTISNTTFTGNNADNNGGGAFVNGGTVTMNSGTFSENTAKNGGSLYVSKTDTLNGNFIMNGGTHENNSVTENGGAVYVSGGSFKMISGSLIDNSATGTTSYGGGAYVTGGNIEIGVSGCNYKGSTEYHTVTHTDKKHPVINGNTAQDSGGGLAVVGEGNITMHCGKIEDNSAPNRGRGLNVYMEKGVFKYNGGDVGKLEEPEVVIVGGTLDLDGNKDNLIELWYYHCNEESHNTVHENDVSMAVMKAAATSGGYIHLPDGEKYWTAADGYRFFGWTFFGPDNDADLKSVRAKYHYKPLGDPINVDQNIDDSENDKTIHMYALWAPETSSITYVDGLEKEVISGTTNENQPASYSIDLAATTINVKDDGIEKPGYRIEGWYIYQNENQNANWTYKDSKGTVVSYEPAYIGSGKDYEDLDYESLQYIETDENGDMVLPVDPMTFGDITLVANYVPQFGDLTITKEGSTIESDQTFMFSVKGQPDNTDYKYVDITVTIQGADSHVVKHLPAGDYTVTEITDWSWRYNLKQIDGVDATVPGKAIEIDRTGDYSIKFKNSNDKLYWLSGDDYKHNLFDQYPVIF